MHQKKIDFKFLFKALEQKFERLEMRFGEVHDRIVKVESSSQRGQPLITPNVERRERVSRFRHGMGGREVRYRNRGDRYGERVDSNLGSVKVKIPTFQGKTDLDAYLEWEKRIKLVFHCHNYSELKKVKLSAI
ncbi:hypothetical protein Q3G72_034201 [Acer saccharum]|nr:hypothetical protein Q3G72_034201 [Acer saccharum]